MHRAGLRAVAFLRAAPDTAGGLRSEWVCPRPRLSTASLRGGAGPPNPRRRGAVAAWLPRTDGLWWARRVFGRELPTCDRAARAESFAGLVSLGPHPPFPGGDGRSPVSHRHSAGVTARFAQAQCRPV